MALVYPLAKRGTFAGGPGIGTHSRTEPPNNWQSDNAIDLLIPKGTKVVALADGVIEGPIGSLGGDDSRFGGQRLYLRTKGNNYYYAHLSKITVKVGQKVKAGQVIGLSGVAAGVAHLHLGAEKGNPLDLVHRRILVRK